MIPDGLAAAGSLSCLRGDRAVFAEERGSGIADPGEHGYSGHGSSLEYM
jgi:hypothetical protein